MRTGIKLGREMCEVLVGCSNETLSVASDIFAWHWIQILRTQVLFAQTIHAERQTLEA